MRFALISNASQPGGCAALSAFQVVQTLAEMPTTGSERPEAC